MKIKILALISGFLIFTGCASVLSVLQSVSGPVPLTEAEVINGLKEALITGKWNTVATSIPGKIAGLKSVNTDLDDYLTNKALNGMFAKVEQEELKIRKDVSARISPLLQRVFGSPDNKTK